MELYNHDIGMGTYYVISLVDVFIYFIAVI